MIHHRALALPKDLVLFLVWDSESETTKDCTLLSSRMEVRDEDSDSTPPKRRSKRKRSKRSSSSKSGDEESESSSDSGSKDWDITETVIYYDV